jgi:electron transfer flavoprotein beta subunit
LTPSGHFTILAATDCNSVRTKREASGSGDQAAPGPRNFASGAALKNRDMKILVCLKQVLAPESELTLDADSAQITAPSAAERRMGRYDAGALEAALQISEARGGAQVDVVTVGPPEAAEVLRRALGMGAEQAVHIVSLAEVEDPSVVAAAIAAVAGGHDLIFTGVMSEDLMQAAVGPSLAVLLDRPCATDAVAFELKPDGLEMTVQEEIEHGARNLVRLVLPAVLTLQSGPWLPRYPSLSGLLKARRKKIRTLDLAAVALGPQRQRCAALTLPPRTRQGRILCGSSGEKADALMRLLRQRGFLCAGVP